MLLKNSFPAIEIEICGLTFLISRNRRNSSTTDMARKDHSTETCPGRNSNDTVPLRLWDSRGASFMVLDD
jgi:hypothetical protein